MWLCVCDCGEIKTVGRTQLVKGHAQSCGCLAAERTAERSRRDVAGERFGYWTAIRPTEKRSGSNIVWECRCECGVVRDVSLGTLSNGSSKSCGCRVKKEFIRGIDLTGRKMGRWAVLYRVHNNFRSRVTYWRCRCECGTERDVSGLSLRQGASQSCGCLRSEAVRNAITKHGLAHTPMYRRYTSMLRNTRRRQRTPKWANLGEICRIYSECPEGMVVDHIVPLSGKTVCGLHVPENLQYLTPGENGAKWNRFESQIIKAGDVM